MISLEDLAGGYRRNLEVIKMQTKDLSHEQSLIQLPFRSNCLNWVVGHILANRCNVLNLLGAEDPRPELNLDHYERESDPIPGQEEGVLKLEELLEHLEDTQQRLEAVLEQETETSLQRLTSHRSAPERPLAYWLFFLFFHDSYHVGQTEILRQAAGVDDKVI